MVAYARNQLTGLRGLNCVTNELSNRGYLRSIKSASDVSLHLTSQRRTILLVQTVSMPAMRISQHPNAYPAR